MCPKHHFWLTVSVSRHDSTFLALLKLRISLLLPNKSLQNFNNYSHRVIIARRAVTAAVSLLLTGWSLRCSVRAGMVTLYMCTLLYSTLLQCTVCTELSRCYRWPATAMDQSKVQSTRQPQVPPARCANCRFAIQPFIFTRSAAHGRLVNSIAGSVTKPVGTVSRF